MRGSRTNYRRKGKIFRFAKGGLEKSAGGLPGRMKIPAGRREIITGRKIAEQYAALTAGAAIFRPVPAVIHRCQENSRQAGSPCPWQTGQCFINGKPDQSHPLRGSWQP